MKIDYKENLWKSKLIRMYRLYIYCLKRNNINLIGIIICSGLFLDHNLQLIEILIEQNNCKINYFLLRPSKIYAITKFIIDWINQTLPSLLKARHIICYYLRGRGISYHSVETLLHRRSPSLPQNDPYLKYYNLPEVL